MIHKEILDYIRDCNRDLIELVTKSVDNSLKSFSTIILADNENIKNKIKEVRDKVETQNGAIRNLNEWKAGVEGGKLRIRNLAIWAPIIIAGLALVLTFSNRKYTERQLWWKQDRMLDSTTRSLPLNLFEIDTLK